LLLFVREKRRLDLIDSWVSAQLKVSPSGRKFTQLQALARQREHFGAEGGLCCRQARVEELIDGGVGLFLLNADSSGVVGHHLSHRLTHLASIVDDGLSEASGRRIL